MRGYRSVEELPETPDLAVVCLPARHVLDAASRRRSRRGTRAICVISAGFAEVGDEGRERQDELLALVRAHGGRLVGPNCLGHRRLGAAAERDVRAAGAAARPGRLLLPERRARARAARRRRRSAESASRPSSRSATRPMSPPTTCSSTGRTTRTRGLIAALPGVVRQPAPVRADRPPRRPQEADPGDEERDDLDRRAGGELTHRGAGGLRGGGRGALPPGRRDSRADARGADRRSRPVRDAAVAARAGGSR